jgi:hypothetical protein
VNGNATYVSSRAEFREGEGGTEWSRGTSAVHSRAALHRTAGVLRLRYAHLSASASLRMTGELPQSDAGRRASLLIDNQAFVNLRSQIATSSSHGGRHLPWVFTESSLASRILSEDGEHTRPRVLCPAPSPDTGWRVATFDALAPQKIPHPDGIGEGADSSTRGRARSPFSSSGGATPNIRERDLKSAASPEWGCRWGTAALHRSASRSNNRKTSL